MEEYPIINGYGGFVLEGGATGVCVLHGGMTSPHTMREFAQFLNGRGYTVSVPLLAGHGRDVESLNQTLWPELIESARCGLEDLERRGCTRRFVVGHSLGGALTLYLAGASDDLAGVVPISAPVFLPLKESMLLNIASSFVHFIPYDFRKVVSDYDEHRALYERYSRVPIRFFSHLTRESIRNREMLYGITCPILIIHGKKDPVVPFRNAEVIHERVRSKRKELLLLDDEEHGPLWWDARQYCFYRIAEFLASVCESAAA